VRKENRLHGFRGLLREIWSESQETEPTTERIREFSDKIVTEYEKAKSEIKDLRAEATSNAVRGAAVIASGTFVLNLPGIIALSPIMAEGLRYWSKSRKLRRFNPATLLFDLENAPRFE
jgi:hypothetical protein